MTDSCWIHHHVWPFIGHSWLDHILIEVVSESSCKGKGNVWVLLTIVADLLNDALLSYHY